MGRRAIIGVTLAAVACGEGALVVDAGPDATFVDASDGCTAFCGPFDASPCDGLACEQQLCLDAGGTTATTISGTVFDPAGTTPLFDAFVYVATSSLTPLSHGAACDKCEN